MTGHSVLLYLNVPTFQKKLFELNVTEIGKIFKGFENFKR